MTHANKYATFFTFIAIHARTASRESSPIRAGLRNGIENGFVNSNGHTNGNGVHLQNGHSNAAEHSDDEYIDTVEVMCCRGAILRFSPSMLNFKWCHFYSRTMHT